MRSKLTIFSRLCVLIMLVATVYPVPKSFAKPGALIYEVRKDHDRDGIGKFYQGREIAHVMGHQAADWLERPEREEEEKTQLLIDSLKLKPGEMVGDIGAGTGYLTRRIAPKILPRGKVYAVEIQQEMLDLLTNKLAGIG